MALKFLIQLKDSIKVACGESDGEYVVGDQKQASMARIGVKGSGSMPYRY